MLGDAGLRRGVRAAGAADDQVRRHPRPRQGVRGDRQGREHPRAGHPRVVQGAAQGAAVAVPERRGALLRRRRRRDARHRRRRVPRRRGTRHRPVPPLRAQLASKRSESLRRVSVAASPRAAATGSTTSKHRLCTKKVGNLARRQRVRRAAYRPGHRGRHPSVEPRRGQEARDHQLPHAQAGEGRPVLREDLRSHPGLGVLLRQVQARALQGHHLRALRRRGHPGQGAP